MVTRLNVLKVPKGDRKQQLQREMFKRGGSRTKWILTVRAESWNLFYLCLNQIPICCTTFRDQESHGEERSKVNLSPVITLQTVLFQTKENTSFHALLHTGANRKERKSAVLGDWGCGVALSWPGRGRSLTHSEQWYPVLMGVGVASRGCACPREGTPARSC